MAKPLTMQEYIVQRGGRIGDPLGLAHDPVLQMAAVGAARAGFEETRSLEDLELWLGATEAASNLGTTKAEGWDENLAALRAATDEPLLADFGNRVLQVLARAPRIALFESLSATLNATVEALAGQRSQYQAVITALTFEDACDDEALSDESGSTPLDSWPYCMPLRAAG